MAKFILIDQSLTGVEGHHYEYDFNILQAAAEAGYQPIIATHRAFRRTAEMPTNWQVLPLFPHTSYSKYTVFSGIGERSLDFRRPLFKPWSERPARWRWLNTALDWRSYLADCKYVRRRAHRIQRFMNKCRKLFRAVPIDSSDLLFVPTATEFDFECLVNFLESSRTAQRVPWHIQFHFNYLEGREPTYAEQSNRFQAMKAHFERLLERVAHHQLFMYTTSQQLAEQYGLMDVADFCMLPYPVSIQLTPAAARSALGRLRITCAGCIRPEKGHQHLNGLVQSLWQDYFSTGRLQLIIQTDQANPMSMFPWASYARSRTKDPAIEFVSFPLPRPDYLQLIQHTHIGLFTYDSERYYARCSGVLVEMLSAGIPVIVPAGCWLAEQIAESIYQHQDKTARQLPQVARYRLRDLRWQAVDGAPIADLERTLLIGGAGAGLVTELSSDRHATQLLALIDTALWPTGSYIRMICEQFDAEGCFLDRSVAVVGQRKLPSRVPSPILMNLNAQALRIRLTFENAFYQHLLPLHGVQVVLLDASQRSAGSPVGSVGLIAADPGEVAALLREMVEHYSHYEATAREFAVHWNHKHHPSQTVLQLQSRASARAGEVRRFAA